MTTHFLPNRAMNYGLMGFLIAKDILHLILPDGKQSLFCFGVTYTPSHHAFFIDYLQSAWCIVPTIGPLCCSLLSEWDGARCWRMCVGSLPRCDKRRSGRRWGVFSVSGAAAGGVGAVFCTADSIAGEQQSPDFRLCVKQHLSLFVHILSSPPHRLIIRV